MLVIDVGLECQGGKQFVQCQLAASHIVEQIFVCLSLVMVVMSIVMSLVNRMCMSIVIIITLMRCYDVALLKQRNKSSKKMKQTKNGGKS